MRSAEEIVRLWRYRRDRSNILLGRMRKIRDVYNGDLVLPFAQETEPAVANMVLMGIDQKAGRIASVVPQIWFPPRRRGFANSEEEAQMRTDAMYGWWEDNDMSTVLTQRSRYLIAYGNSSTLVWPDLKNKIPRWKPRNPLGVFPSDETEYPGKPVDIITAHNKPFSWLRENYPNVARQADSSGDLTDLSQCVILEYSDAEQVSVVFAGVDTTWEPGYVSHQWETDTWGGFADFLQQVPNRAETCLGVTATRPVLDREQGEFDQIIGMYGASAKLTALTLDAIEKDIYPDTYLVSRPNEVADFVHGPVDGRTGEVNVVKGGDVQTLHEQPGWMTDGTIDRLERAQRLTAGIPAEFGGESTTNVRTGRRGDAILSAIIDFPMAEAQRALAKSMKQENDLAMKIAKAWWGESTVSYHVISGRKARSGEYTPNKLFQGTTYHKVMYPVAGADMNNLVVGIGQRIGLGTMSKRTAAELDPMIDDPEFETDRITSEQLEAALLASVSEAAAQGMLSPKVVGRIISLVRSNKEELPKAIETALAEEAAEREAQQQEQQQQAAGPEQMMAQLAAEGQGQPEGIPSIQEPGQGMQNLQGMYQALRQTNTRSAGRQELGGAA